MATRSFEDNSVIFIKAAAKAFFFVANPLNRTPEKSLEGWGEEIIQHLKPSPKYRKPAS
jgi:hypothetical protein